MSIILHPLPRYCEIHRKPKIPGDKSISHRALILASLARGKTVIKNLLHAEDVNSTWKCLEELGVQISREKDSVEIHGRGIASFLPPTRPLYCGNSGTTLRLLAGVLAGCPFSTQLEGDDSLSRRPMKRVASPLVQMGASIHLTDEKFAPVLVHGRKDLQGIDYDLPVASAQVKSAILQAGLSAKGETQLRGKINSRDHTERLLAHFGASIKTTSHQITLPGNQTLHGNSLIVPGDLSSAAYWVAATVLTPGCQLELEQVSLNPSRIGMLRLLLRMGAKLEMEVTSSEPEPMGTLRIVSSPLKGTLITDEEVPGLIDELPLIAILATFAEGRTEVRGAGELRVKETDRIEAIATNLRAMGGKIETFSDGFVIEGPQKLSGAKVDSFQDHRIAMAFSIAALKAESPTEILREACVDISYPEFYSSLRDWTQSS